MRALRSITALAAVGVTLGGCIGWDFLQHRGPAYPTGSDAYSTYNQQLERELSRGRGSQPPSGNRSQERLQQHWQEQARQVR